MKKATPNINISINACIVSACLLLPTLATGQAEEDTTPKWYQVELFIFANNNPDAAGEEHWRQDLGLKYPQNIVSLIHPSETEQKQFSEQDTTGLPVENPATADTVQSPPSTGIDQGQADTPLPEQTVAGINNDPDQLPAIQPVTEQPFILLPPEHHQLTAIAKRIVSTTDFRPLFHQAWRQPITNGEESANILIRTGEQFDSHYELEGTITLNVERYLHIDTDLWLSTFVSNIGREQEPWPVLPKAPLV